jgi:hypothetical protein
MFGSAAPARSSERFNVSEPDAIGSNRVEPPEFGWSLLEGLRHRTALQPPHRPNNSRDIALGAADKFLYGFDRIGGLRRHLSVEAIEHRGR